MRFGLWCLTPLSTQYQLNRGGQFGAGNRGTRRKPQTCLKPLTNHAHNDILVFNFKIKALP